MATPEKIRALANAIEQMHEVTHSNPVALPDHEWKNVHDRLYTVLQIARDRLVTYLAYTDDMLVGAELCNECGEVVGTVVRIEYEPDLMIVTNRSCVYPSDVACWEYFRLPGSDAYGEHALAELARARADQAEKQRPVPA